MAEILIGVALEPDRFTADAPGRLVRVAIPGAELAFVPDPLPPAWEWPADLWPLLSQARAALARLDGIGSYLPDPEILLRPLQHREAQTSSRLEGTFARPAQILLLELEPVEPRAGRGSENAAREVFNYGRALRLRQTEALPLSLRLVSRLHEVLMEGVGGADLRPGEFRRQWVQIGRPARFVPPPPDSLDACLGALEAYLQAPRRYHPLVDAFLVHYQFETIHPFLDGNGRVGRLLLSLTVADWCRLSRPWLHMSPFFERNKDRYLELLFEVSASGDFESWIRFCLEGVVEEAEDAAARCRRLLDVRARFYDRVHGTRGSARLIRVIDGLFATPLISISEHARRCDVTYPTAKSDLEKLADAGVLVELPDAPHRSFYAPAVFEVIYDDDSPA